MPNDPLTTWAINRFYAETEEDRLRADYLLGVALKLQEPASPIIVTSVA